MYILISRSYKGAFRVSHQFNAGIIACGNILSFGRFRGIDG